MRGLSQTIGMSPEAVLASPGSVKAVTIKDVAREAEVSVASVSRVLNGVGRVGEATRARILITAERLRYVPHEGARSLINRRTNTIGMILPDLHGEFFSETLRGADAAARARGLHLLVSTSHGDTAEAVAAIRSMRGRVDGLLIMSPHLGPDFLSLGVADGLPTVLMNAHPVKDRPCVNVADYEGAVAMVRHLTGNGRRRIAHIAGPTSNNDASERLRGYMDVRPTDLDGRYIIAGDFTAASGYAAGLILGTLNPRPDAVFAANDMMAVGCMEALGALGLRVPSDIAIGGFDDVPVAHFVRPALTTMRTDVADLARKALERLTAFIEDPTPDGEIERIVPTLVIRESCGDGSRRRTKTSQHNSRQGGT